ncbi:MAG: sugar phosphate isomerase/epimerase [Phycisphaerae bacterium]|nr:sugar phosphate isomerase/epimerase [Phycisphaerae bacterium]
MTMPVGVQLYSVRMDCARDLPGTLAAVAGMGYDGVEFAGYYGRSAADLRKLLDSLGLRCCGTHTGLDTLLGDALKTTIEFSQTLGNKFLIVPSMPGPRRAADRAVWLDNAKVLNDVAAKVRETGLRVGYHSHEIDTLKAAGQSLWEIFGDNTTADVVMQTDTGNLMIGGMDVVACLKRYPGRAATVHLKGLARRGDGFDWTFAGEGDVPWREVLEFCAGPGGTEWYIVEHENYPLPPLSCVQRCLKNIKSLRS